MLLKKVRHMVGRGKQSPKTKKNKLKSLLFQSLVTAKVKIRSVLTYTIRFLRHIWDFLKISLIILIHLTWIWSYLLYVEVVTFHFDCTMNPCPRMATLYSVQRRSVRAVRAKPSLEWIMNHLFFTNDNIITGTRRAKTSLARERWTSKCHIWTRGSLPPTLREMHPVRHQVGNRAQKITLRLMQQHLITKFLQQGQN